MPCKQCTDCLILNFDDYCYCGNYQINQTKPDTHCSPVLVDQFNLIWLFNPRSLCDTLSQWRHWFQAEHSHHLCRELWYLVWLQEEPDPHPASGPKDSILLNMDHGWKEYPVQTIVEASLRLQERQRHLHGGLLLVRDIRALWSTT